MNVSSIICNVAGNVSLLIIRKDEFLNYDSIYDAENINAYLKSNNLKVMLSTTTLILSEFLETLSEIMAYFEVR